MSGPDNLQGIDYQVSFTVLKLLQLFKESSSSVRDIQFESLSEDEEDLSLFHSDGTTTFIQVKKKTEGYQWTPSTLKPVLEHFHAKSSAGASFVFVTDRGVSLDVVKLKRALRKEPKVQDDALLSPFTSTRLSLDILRRLLPRVSLLSDYYASPDESDPARTLREQATFLLSSRPFVLTRSPEIVLSALWQFVFDASKTAARVPFSILLEQLGRAGAATGEQDTPELPDLRDFVGRTAELADIQAIHTNTHLIVVRGLAGTGKTLLLARLATELRAAGRPTFWCPLNPLLNPSSLIRQLSVFFAKHFDVDPTRNLPADDISSVTRAFLAALREHQCCLIFDAHDQASDPTRVLIEGIFRMSFSPDIRSSIVVSTKGDIASYSRIDVTQRRVVEYHLGGYSLEDSLLVLARDGILMNSDDAKTFHNAVGGHPMSYVLLREILAGTQTRELDLEALANQGIELTRTWLLDRVIESQPLERQSVLKGLSVFDHPFAEGEAEAVLNADIAAAYILIDLASRGLVTHVGQEYMIHEALRNAAYALNPRRVRIDLHHRCSAYYMSAMQKSRREGVGVSGELLSKWGSHTERAVGTPSQPELIAHLLRLKNDEIDVLWAIHRFGFPFSFAHNDSSTISDVLTSLELAGFVTKSLAADTEDLSVSHTSYTLAHDDFEYILFLSYLCQSKGVSGHLGYIPKFEPNHNWEQQGLLCQWEHCIELCPLPPITRAQHEEHVTSIKRKFDAGDYADASPERLDILRYLLESGVPDDAPEEPDLEMEAGACPVFGHVCPGGRAQADQCRVEEQMMESDTTSAEDSPGEAAPNSDGETNEKKDDRKEGCKEDIDLFRGGNER